MKKSFPSFLALAAGEAAEPGGFFTKRGGDACEHEVTGSCWHWLRRQRQYHKSAHCGRRTPPGSEVAPTTIGRPARTGPRPPAPAITCSSTGRFARHHSTILRR